MLNQLQPDLARIAVALIDEPPLMSRNGVNEAHVDELVEAMRAHGFTSTILLARVDERYVVIAGHHRLLAARRAPLVTVPALVYPSYELGMEALQGDENDLQMPSTPCDQAVWYAQLLERHPAEGTDGVAIRVRKKRDFVEARLSLLHGDRAIFDALAEGAITIGVAQQLNRCTEDPHRRMLLDMAVRGGATVGLVTQWIVEWKTVHAPAGAHVPAIENVSSGGAVQDNEYFRCWVCGESHATANMQPRNIHDYCVRQATDPATGVLRSRADYVEFPRTRDGAEALIARVIERFPELVPAS